MRQGILYGDVFLVNGERMQIVKVHFRDKEMIGFCSLKNSEVKYIEENKSISSYLEHATFEWKDEKEKKGIVVHLFECTSCDIGDFTSNEWNEATKDELEGFEELLYEPIEECTDLEKEYVCPGCYRNVKLGNCIHNTIEK